MAFYPVIILQSSEMRENTYIGSLKMETVFAINPQGLAVNLECNWSSVNIS